MWINGDMCIKRTWISGTVVSCALNGVFPKDTVNKMNRGRLEKVVTQLIVQTTGVSTKTYRASENNNSTLGRPQWWPKDIEFDYPVDGLRRRIESSSLNWRSVLQYLVSSCCSFYNSNPLFVSFLPSARCRTFESRKVLAPTQANENIQNQQSTKRKRKSTEESDYIYDIKKLKLIHQTDLKPCKVILPKKPVDNFILQNSCLTRHAVVPLRDVFREIPSTKQVTKEVNKDDFLNYFSLGQPNAEFKKTATAFKRNFVRLCTVPSIPFSSDIGKLITKRENIQIPEEVHLKRIDRVEWYLKNPPQTVVSDQSFGVSYEEKGDVHCHLYKFGKKQFYQNHQRTRDAFVHFIVKKHPVVCIERINVHKWLNRSAGGSNNMAENSSSLKNKSE